MNSYKVQLHWVQTEIEYSNWGLIDANNLHMEKK